MWLGGLQYSQPSCSWSGPLYNTTPPHQKYLPDDDDVEVQLITLPDDAADVRHRTLAAGWHPGRRHLHSLRLRGPTAAEEEISTGSGGADDLQEDPQMLRDWIFKRAYISGNSQNVWCPVWMWSHMSSTQTFQLMSGIITSATQKTIYYVYILVHSFWKCLFLVVSTCAFVHI